MMANIKVSNLAQCPMATIILASTSPYRKEQLERLQIPFTQAAPVVDEEEFKSQGLDHEALSQQLALLKARAISANNPQAIVIGGDQVASFNGAILSKPKTKAKAIAQLQGLSGQQHQLIAPTDMNMNLMEVCKSYELPVKGTCGGMAMCASCHCYIDSDHLLNEPSDDEEDMLDQAFFVENNSRLGCQIFMSSHLEGLQVTLAPESD